MAWHAVKGLTPQLSAESGVPPRDRCAVFVAIGLAVGLCACSSLTSVDAPDVVQPGQLNNPAGALTLFAGTYGLFGQSYSAAAEESGVLTDELVAVSFFLSGPDQRALPQNPQGSSGQTYDAYVRLSQARVNGLLTIAALERWAPAQRGRTAETFALNALAELLFAEDMCSGIPLSSISGSTVNDGTQLTTQQLLTRALADLDSAAAYAGDSADVRFLAQIVRGRSLLNLGQYAAAATAVVVVPTSYVYRVTYPPPQGNSLANDMTSAGARLYSVADHEGGNGLPFISANDPRVPTQFLGISPQDGVTPFYIFTPFMDMSAPLVVASGVEARLIEAEAALQAGDAATYLAKLNEPRQTAIAPAMAPLTDPGTSAGRVDLLFSERAFWLFLTAHRQGDLRRLVRQYGRNQAQVFPTGPYKGGPSSYGSDVTFPLFGEDANPNIGPANSCIDRNP